MPILDRNALEFFSRSPDQTRRIGMRLGALLKVGDVIALAGELGSGKTTFIQGIAAGWGSLDQVSSPTFVLVKVYRQLDGGRLYHLDAFRLQEAHEAEVMDMDQMIETGPLVIEWADHIEAALPPERLWIELRWMAEEQRGMHLTAQGGRYEKLLSKLRQTAFGVM